MFHWKVLFPSLHAECDSRHYFTYDMFLSAWVCVSCAETRVLILEWEHD